MEKHMSSFLPIEVFSEIMLGVLYVPTDGDPAAFADLNEQSRTWIDKYDEHWFFASHR
jgi:hypothetical protein